MIKLVATDIDGTILPYTGRFTQGVTDCIKKLQQLGVKVVIVTGRMDKGARKISQRLNLDTPVVSYNGGFIKDENTVLYERYLSPEHTRQIVEWANSNGVHLNLYSNDTLYSQEDDYEIRCYSKYQQLNYIVKDFSQIPYERIHKLLAIDYTDADRVTGWVDEMSKRFPELYIIKSTPYFCEFSPKEATKACAVNFLKKYWGLKDDEVLAIGDQDNDIELLKSGGIRVAMANGTQELKDVADYITDTVENDGFVKAIEEFVFSDYEREGK